MTIGINTSPLSGRDGDKLTASMVKARLDQELVGNVSLRVLADRAAGRLGGAGPRRAPARGARRDHAPRGLRAHRRASRRSSRARSTASVHEPVERLAIDVPEDYVGVITQLLALRKGRLEQMVNHGTGWVRMEYLVPARGLIGFRTEFLTETRGTGILHHVFDGYEPWHGEMRTRPTGSLVADRRGLATSFALLNLQERGQLFVGPGAEVYEGMVVGENARAEDLDVNATKEKKLTNMRSSTADELVRLIPPRPLSLEQALELIREDECVEVTPGFIRLRKVELSGAEAAVGGVEEGARAGGCLSERRCQLHMVCSQAAFATCPNVTAAASAPTSSSTCSDAKTSGGRIFRTSPRGPVRLMRTPASRIRFTTVLR